MNDSVTAPQETTWWSKFFLVSALISIVILVAGPFGYKFGVTDLMPSLVSILVSLVAAVLVLIGGLVMVIVAARRSLTKDRNLILVAMLISLIPMVFVLPQMMKAQSIPAIHDISTDTNNPPEFVAILAVRSKAANDLVYDDLNVGTQTAEVQQQAYPAVQTLESSLSISDAVNRAAGILEKHGLEVVASNPELGIVEATATTFWFGFKDDVVVRVRRDGNVTNVDVRSVSRVGQSDIGANAARIEKFLQAFAAN